MKKPTDDNQGESPLFSPKQLAHRSQCPERLIEGQRHRCEPPLLMTEGELINFLRIPEISNSENYHNVIEHLKKVRGLPRIHICHTVLYPQKAVLAWIEKETDVGK